MWLISEERKVNQLTPIVSVIIPVYNQEKYLEECLKSVCQQTLQNLEIICIDDGSTDSSLSILKRYQSKDSRITVLSQKNGGAGTARNLGMKLATGTYLSFLDSDDRFEPTMLEKMVKSIEQDHSDVVVCRCNCFDAVAGTIKPMPWSIREDLLPDRRPFSSKEVKRDFFELFVWWPWDKLFRKSFIDSLKIRYQQLRTTNDLFFVCASVLMAERISCITDILVHQRINLNTSLSSTREKSWSNFLTALTALKEYMVEQKIYSAFQQDFINYCLNFSLWHLDTIKGHSYGLLYQALKQEWFQKFGITEHEKSYFYNQCNFNRVLEILNKSPEDLLFERIQKLENERNSLQNEFYSVSHSMSFKVGRLLTAIPRKIRDVLKS